MFDENIENFSKLKKAEGQQGGYERLVRDYATYVNLKLNKEQITKRLLVLCDILLS